MEDIQADNTKYNAPSAPIKRIKLVHSGNVMFDNITDHAGRGAGGASMPAFGTASPSVFGASSASTFGQAQAPAAKFVHFQLLSDGLRLHFVSFLLWVLHMPMHINLKTRDVQGDLELPLHLRAPLGSLCRPPCPLEEPLAAGASISEGFQHQRLAGLEQLQRQPLV